MTVRRSMIWIAVAASGCAVLSWLSHVIDDAREEARATLCDSNITQMGLALQNYASKYGCFPPAYVADATGKPLYSWRVLLMAEIDRGDGWLGGRLANEFHFDEPWDSPNNSKLHNVPSKLFQCPIDPVSWESTETNYVVVVGPGTLFPGDGTSRRVAEVTDGIDDTLMVVEITSAGIHWMEPRELNWETMSFQINDPAHLSISSHHDSDRPYSPGPRVLTVTEAVTPLSPNLKPETLKALLTIAGGEHVEKQAWYLR